MRQLFIALVVLFPFWGFGQLSALKEELSKAQSPEEQTIAHNKLAWAYRDLRSDSALYHATRALKMAEANELHHHAVQALNYMGVAYRNLSVYSKAFEVYLQALKKAEDIGDEEQRGYALINIGNLYLFQQNFEGAIRYFIQALDQAQALGNKRMQGYCFVNLGRTYRGQGEYGQSELYYKQALEVRRDLDDVYGIKAVEIDLADVYRREGDLGKALDYSFEVKGRLDIETDGRALVMLNNNIAKIYLLRSDLPNAERFGLEALQLAEQFSSRYDVKEVLLTLSRIYESEDDFVKAYRRYVDYAELNQQLFSEENIRKIEQLRNQYEIQQQEAENEFLRRQDELNKQVIERQQTIILLTGGGVLLLLIIAAISFRAYRIRKRLSEEISQQKDQIEEDKNLIERQSEKLKELDAAKSRFFANVSHDLRSPLSLIMGNLEMIGEDEEAYLTSKAKKSLEVAFKNSKRLLYLTDEINDITRLEEGKIRLKLEQVRLNSYLKMLSEMFRSSAEYKGVKLEFRSSLEDHEVFAADPRQFEKIFYNLVSNALRHTRKGESIIISCSRNVEATYISIQDTGDGIPAHSLPHIFDRFYQSKENQFKSKEGLGIGLALVRELVQLHDGEISVSSEMGVGTTFTITLRNESITHLPGYQPEEANYVKDRNEIFRELEIDEKARPNVSIDGEKHESTILLVDDHPEIRYYIRQILEDNYNVIEAAHGIEALDLLEHREVHLIITDLMMPWMDGFELIESINGNERFKKIPLLVVSARISDDTKEKVLYKGVNDFIKKPFQKKELLLRIDNLLEQKTKYGSFPGENVFEELSSKETGISTLEEDIIMKLESVVKESISDPRLSVMQLADALAASERQVYRMVKRLTGLTPHEYITEVRLQYVDYLIRNKKVKNATDAARRVGQNNVTTFNRQYQRRYGVKPSELINA